MLRPHTRLVDESMQVGEYLSRFTFYDVMGYLLPGLVGICAICAGLSAIDHTWSLPAINAGGEWFALIISAYFAGHAIQGLSQRIYQRSVLRNQVARRSKPAVTAVVRRALERHQIQAGGTEADYAALDALKLCFDDREVFIARQGFFRGSSLSFALAAVALVLACLFNSSVTLFGLTLGRALCAIAGGLCSGVALLFFYRYRDFIQHELEYAAAAGATTRSGSG
jgi:hypothetical protein